MRLVSAWNVVAGLGLTIGSAWAATLWSPLGPPVNESTGGPPAGSYRERRCGAGIEEQTVIRFADRAIWQEQSSGWPFPCLRSAQPLVGLSSNWNGSPNTAHSGRLVRDGMPLPRGAQAWVVDPDRSLPLDPLVPGFLANLAVWTLATAVLARAGTGAIALLRGMRAKCEACGHRLTLGQARCPECGQRVAAPVSPAAADGSPVANG